MKAVLKLGGFAFDTQLSDNRLREYVALIERFSKRNRLVIVTGGGSTARRYITAARQLGASEFACDQIGIRVSRLNASLLAAGLGELVFPRILESPDSMVESIGSGLITIMGGLQPGQSTNAVAALAAEAMRADLLVNATDVAGVYTADPRKSPNAKRLDEVTPEQLIAILSTEGIRAGEYDLMDPLAIRIIQRSKLPTVIVDGRNTSNVEKAMQGKRIGTRIIHSEKR